MYQLTQFDDEAPYQIIVYDRFNEINRGCSSLTDEFKETRLKFVVVPRNIDDML